MNRYWTRGAARVTREGVRHAARFGGLAAGAVGSHAYSSYKGHRKVSHRAKKNHHLQRGGTSDIRGNDLDRGFDSSHLWITTGRPLHKKVIGEPIILHECIRGIISNGEGLQAPVDIKAFGSVSQWNVSTAPTGSVPPNGAQSLKRWFDLNPSQKTTGGNLYGAQVPADDKLYLQSAVCEIDFGDFVNLPCEVDVYVFQCKKDCNEAPLTQLWADALGQEQGGVAAIGFPGRGSTAGMGYPNPNYYGLKPQETRLFNQFYKTLKVKKVLLARGATEKLRINLDLNLLGDQAKLTENQTPFPRGSIYISCIAKGSVILDNGADTGPPVTVFSPASSNSSYSGTYVGYVINTKYKFRQMAATVARQRMSYGEYLINTGAPDANQRSMGQTDNAGGQGRDQAN